MKKQTRTIEIFEKDASKLDRAKIKLGLKSKAWVLKRMIETFNRLKIWGEMQ